MKKVLLTNAYLKNYSGSEIDTLTIANYLCCQGFNVSIFTLDYGLPLIKDLNKRIKIITLDNINEMEEYFDIIWAHHWPLLDYVLFNKIKKVNYIIYHSLSPYEPYELLPKYYLDLTDNYVLSEEHMTKFKEKKYKNLKILPNYSFENYFKLNKKLNKKIEKICIVSNHIPNELLLAKKIFEKNNIQVDIYGRGYNYVTVDDKLLLNYDVIISIGKTIYYGISLGIPCYCYDHFGGDGYITESNFINSLNYNFSGRAKSIKKDENKIVSEVLNNYENVIKSNKTIKKLAYDTFCFENNINKIIKGMKDKNKVDLNKIKEQYINEDEYSRVFIKEINNSIKDSKLCVSVHFDCNGIDYTKSFNEYYQDNEEVCVSIKINVPKDCKKIYINFSNRPLKYIEKIYIDNDEISLSESAHCLWKNNKLVSLNNMANIGFSPKVKEKSSLIEFKIKNINLSDIINDVDNSVQYNRLLEKYKELEKKYINKE